MYWKKLVPDAADDPGPPGARVGFHTWNDVKLSDGTRATAFGWASYRMKVRLPDWAKTGSETLALGQLDASSAYRLVIRDAAGHLLATAESGKVGIDPQQAHPFSHPVTVRFAPVDDLVLTAWVSNWDHGRGGPSAVPILGRSSDVDRVQTRQLVMDFIIAGLVLMMAGHHFSMFALRPRDRAPLWFALFCLSIGARTLLIRHYPVQVWPEHWSWPLQLRLEYLAFYFVVACYLLFFQSVFGRASSSRVGRAIFALVIGFALVTIATPAAVYTRMLAAFQALTMLIIVWSSWQLAGLVRRRNPQAVMMMICLVLCALSVGYDVLISRHLLIGSYASHYGLTGVLFVQSFTLAYSTERARRDLETRNADVQQLNESLRRNIGERSRELREALMQLDAKREKHELEPGEILAERYRVVRHIGAGGMAEVYEVARVGDGARLALKRVRGAWDRDKLARFAREAELATRVAHPNVVSMVDFVISGSGECFIVMELVTGGSLEQHRVRFGDRAWALPVLRQLVESLAAIHRERIVHRDLKPANILLADEVVKLADFGIAGLKETALPSMASLSVRELPALAETAVQEVPALAETMNADPKMTRAGTVMGSPRYMAPELFAGSERATRRSDLFSLGVVAFELLTGRCPFDPPAILERLEGRTPPLAPSLTELVPGLDPRLATVLDRCLYLEPNARPNLEDVRVALADA